MLLGLLTGPFGKWIIDGMVVLAVIAALFGYLKFKEHEAAAEALIKFNAAQQAETIKENQAYQKNMDDILKQAAAIAEDNAAKLNQLNDNTVNIVKNNNTVKQSPVDPIFNNTLKALKGIN